MKGWEELGRMFKPESSDLKDLGMGGRRESLRHGAAGRERTQRWKGRMDVLTGVKTHHDFCTLLRVYYIFPPLNKKGQHPHSKSLLIT